jgi:hypothetical protein
VIRLTRPRLPCRLLTGEHDRESVEVGHNAPIDGLIKREQPGLVSQQMPDGQALLALLRELGPVPAYALVVVEPAAGMSDGHRHCGQPLGGRVDDHHAVPLPRVACPFVPDPAPQVDDLRSAVVSAAGAAQLVSSGEVLHERVAHGLEAATDMAFNRHKVRRGNGHDFLLCGCCHPSKRQMPCLGQVGGLRSVPVNGTE